MSKIIATAKLGGFKTTIHATGTINATTLTNAIRSSNIPTQQQKILDSIILLIIKRGFVKVEELIAKAYEAFTSDPDSFNLLIDIIEVLSNPQ